MKSSLIKIAAAAAFGVFALTASASAQQTAQAFDGKKFFDELSNRGFSAPAGFDGKKFFEEQTKTGGNNSMMPPMVDMPK